MQQPGNAIATPIAGGILAGALVMLVWRLKNGAGYWAKPAGRLTRAEDPFSFWLSPAVPVGIAVFLLIDGGWMLLGQWTK